MACHALRSLFAWSTPVALAIVLSACGLPTPQPAGQSPVGQAPAPPARSSNPARPASPPAPDSAPALTTTVKRGSLQATVDLSGVVVPGRTAQLAFRSAGTVRAVHVRPGQMVHSGEPLVELAVDERVAGATRIAPSPPDGATQAPVEEARAAVARAEIALREAERARDAAGSTPADLEVQRAQLAVDEATADVAKAEVAARQPAETAARLAANVRAAENKLAEAVARRDQLQADLARAEAAREVERQRAQLAVEQARDELTRAQIAARQPEGDAPGVAAPEAAAVSEAERQVAAAAIRRGAASGTGAASATNRPAEQQLAQLDLDAARDQLAQAQQTAQQAEQRRAEAAQSGASPTALAVRAAERRLATATSRLQQLPAGPPATASGELRLAELDVAQAQDELAQAQAAAEAAPHQDEDAAEAGKAADASAMRAAERRRSEAALRLEQAQANAEQARARAGGAAQRELLDLQVTAAREALTAAQARLSAAEVAGAGSSDSQNDPPRDGVLVAPFDGAVMSVDVEVNQAVVPNITVVRLEQSGSVAVEAAASPSDITRLALGQPAEVRFADLPDAVAAGTLTAASPVGISQGDRAVYPVRIDLSAAPATARVGTAASIRVTVGQAENVLHVPAAAVQKAGSTTTVTRVRPDGQVEKVTVLVGRTIGEDVEIQAGLAEGDTVALDAAATPPPAGYPPR